MVSWPIPRNLDLLDSPMLDVVQHFLSGFGASRDNQPIVVDDVILPEADAALDLFRVIRDMTEQTDGTFACWIMIMAHAKLMIYQCIGMTVTRRQAYAGGFVSLQRVHAFRHT